MKKMELQILAGEFSVCKLSHIDQIGQIDHTRDFTFFSKTDDELSLLCPSDCVPPDVTASEANWKGLKIKGTLDFSMLGVIAKIAHVLKEAKISIFVVSTYNTDYIFLKADKLSDGIQALTHSGYVIK